MGLGGKETRRVKRCVEGGGADRICYKYSKGLTRFFIV